MSAPLPEESGPSLRLFRGEKTRPHCSPGAQRLLRPFVVDEYFPRRLQGHSSLTRADYLGTVNKADKLAQLIERSPALLSHLRDDFLEKIIAWLLQENEWTRQPGFLRTRPIGNATINKQLVNLRAFAHFADEKGYQPYAITIGDLPEPERLMQAWRREQVGQLLDAALRVPDPVWRRKTRVPDALNLSAVIYIIYETGVRISALMAAQRTQYDATAHVLRVPGEDQKDWQDLLRPLSPQACDVLRELDRLSVGRQRLIDWEFDRGGPPWKCLRDALRRALKLAKLPSTRYDQFHRLRRTFATYTAIELGLERTRELLGHSSLETTCGYIDWTIYNELKAPYRMPPPIFSGAKQRELF